MREHWQSGSPDGNDIWVQDDDRMAEGMRRELSEAGSVPGKLFPSSRRKPGPIQ
jgi:hypothetical protein